MFVSAAGWVSNEKLLVATATDLRLFNILTGLSEQICQLESNNFLQDLMMGVLIHLEVLDWYNGNCR